MPALAVQSCASAISILAAAPISSGNNALRIATGSMSLHDECTVELIDIETESSGGLHISSYQPAIPTSRFPPSSLSFAPSSCPFADETILVAGEAVSIWQMGRLVAYVSPQALGFSLSDTPRRPWTVTRAEWSKYSPDNILACHRDGPICVYPVERLPGASSRLETRATLTRSERGFFGRLANSLLSPKTPATEIPNDPNKSTCEVITTVEGDGFFRDARFLSQGNLIAGVQDGTDRVILYDLRVAGTRQTPVWEAASSTPSKLLIEPELHPHAICGLDRVHNSLVLYDLRVSQNMAGRLTGLKPVTMFSANAIVGTDCIFNDASWEYTEGDPSGAEHIHIACQGECAPVVSVNVHSFSTNVVETSSWGSKNSAGLSVVSRGRIGVFASAKIKRDPHMTMPVAPRGLHVDERFVEASSWELGVVTWP